MMSRVLIYDTLSKEKKELNPKKDSLRIFVCGPTVYDHAHIGHARTYLAFDMFVKYLRHEGYSVFYLQNITDVDDKIIARAKEEEKTPKQVAEEQEKKYMEDMDALSITSIDKYARASEYMEEIVEQIKELLNKGFAYQTDSGVYFRVKKFKDYGKLSKQNLEKMREDESSEQEKDKEDTVDFALWKLSKPGEPKWESPWGEGRPGWHIEDTAITHKVFESAQYEIHGGARDLIFPHHEAEIAQLEAAYEVDPMVEFWMHTGFLQVEGEKMSKSLKNFITIRDILDEYSPQTLRMFLATKHYRSPIDYTKDSMQEAENTKKRLEEFQSNIQGEEAKNTENDRKIKERIDGFWANLADDFNTPKAFAELFQLITHTNKKSGISNKDKTDILKLFDDINSIFHLTDTETENIPDEIIELAKKREMLRKEKEWDKADKVRGEIEQKGFYVKDTPDGFSVKKKT